MTGKKISKINYFVCDWYLKPYHNLGLYESYQKPEEQKKKVWNNEKIEKNKTAKKYRIHFSLAEAHSVAGNFAV